MPEPKKPTAEEALVGLAVMATKPKQAQELYEIVRAELERLREENERLSDWLLKIDGGDHPEMDPEVLQRWAWDALTGWQCP